MIKAKRFLSAFMALVMVATMFTCLGTVANARYSHDIGDWSTSWNRTFDANEVYGVRSYAELAATYGDTDVCSTNPWVYCATEVYEYNTATSAWELTDHYVQPGEQLKFKWYVKSNCALATSQWHTMFERDFFDVLADYTGSATPSWSANYQPQDGYKNTGYPTSGTLATDFGGEVNTANPYYGAPLSQLAFIPKAARQVVVYSNSTLNGISDNTWKDRWDDIALTPQWDSSGPNCISGQTDEYLCSAIVSVRTTTETVYASDGTTSVINPVPDGTIGLVGMDEQLTRMYNKGLQNYFAIAADTTYKKTDAKSFQNAGASYNTASGIASVVTADTFITDDMNHTFIIGTPSTGGYNAKFYDADGTTEYTTLAQSNATTVTMPTYTKDGYTLGGWIDTATNTTYTVGQSVTLTADSNFKAIWTASSYTATFNSDGALSSTLTGTNITLPDALTKSGYRFDGWMPTGGTTALAAGSAYTLTADTTFNAVWTQVYTATFMDGTSTLGTAEYAAGDTITFPTVTAREGYTYAWSPTSTTMPAANTTYTVVWTASSSSITFETNGGSTIAAISGSYGDAVNAPADPTKTGYTFAGWYSDSALTTAATVPTTLPATALTLYAKWTAKTYTASFKISYNGEISDYTSQQVEYGATFTAPDLPTEAGYSFTAWTPSTFVMDAEGKDYTTTKTANSYTISFVDSTGNPITSGSQTYGSVLSCPTDPTLEGSTFTGWTSDDSSFVAKASIGTATVPARNTTYTATFGTTPYTITYKVDGTVFTTQTAYYGNPISTPTYTPAAGYSWSDWQEVPATMPANDITINSTTTQINYTITYYDYTGGTVVATYATAHYGDTFPVPATPTRDGYTFAGWDNSATTVTGNATVTGIWNVNTYPVTLAYGLDGGTTEDYGTIAYGNSINTADLSADAAIDGYTYVWQYNGTTLGSTFTVPALAANTPITLTAVYTPIIYNIQYQINGTNYGTPVNVTFGTAVTANDLPTETGYDFTAWAWSKTDGTAVTAPTTMPAYNLIANTTKTAHVYTDTWYDIDGTTVLFTTTEAYGANITVQTLPVHEGIEGISWYPVPGTQEANDMTFTARGSAGLVNYSILTKVEQLDGTYSETTTNYSGTTGDTATVPASMQSKTGYTVDTANSVLSATILGNGTTQLTVTFKLNSYTITVKDNGAETPLTYKYGAAVTDPTPAGKTGYTFTSWAWTKTSGSTLTKPATMPAYDVIATANYTINNYNLIPVVDGTEGTATSVTYGTTIPTLAAQTKTGYTFSGWFSDADYTTAFDFTQAMPANDVRAYAKFTINKYTVTYNTNGGTTIASYTGDYGSSVPTVANPTKEGYTFSTWSPSIPATLTADITVTAVYTINKYNVVFKDGDTTLKTISSVAYGTDMTTLSAPTPTKTGYTFTSWTPTLPAVMPDNAVTVSAVYTANKYNVVFYAIEGDTTAYNTISDVTFGTDYTFPTCDTVRQYYTFEGWKVAGTTTVYAAGTTKTLDAEGITFVGSWKQDTSACRVQSVERVTTPYYTCGMAQYNITIAKDVKPEQVIVEFNRGDSINGKCIFQRMDYELGTELITNIATNAEGCEVWTVTMTLAATTEPTYMAYCTVDGVTESTTNAYKFGVTYDEKADAAISTEFLSAAISNTQTVRGSYLTWTVTTSTNVEWLEFKFTYTTKSGTVQTASAYYKFANYLNATGDIVVTDADNVRTWSIAMQFTYLGNDDYVDQSWTVNYRCLKDSKWYSGKLSDGNGGYTPYNPTVRVASKAAVFDPAPVATLDKYTLVSAVVDKAAPAVGDYVYFTVKTTSDVSKVRLSYNYTSGSTAKTKRCTYQQTSSNVTNYDTTETGYITWTIRYKITTAASDNLFSVDCRGVSWGDAKTVTVAVA